MDAWSFLVLSAGARIWGEEVLKFEAPFAAGVGVVVGLVGGLLFVLARRRPSLSTSLALGLLFACATGPVKESVLRLLVGWGWTVHMEIQSHWLAAVEIPASGAIIGAT